MEKALSAEFLLNEGFEYETEKGVFTKTIDGRSIRCYKPNINVNAGYWVCDIWTAYSPVQNSKIVTDEDIIKFIHSTCPEETITIAECPDVEI
ncbi:MAG: hypothetical protein K2K43_06075 [Alistipes sp.]|nr:hypothetical protein [Alistipes sp.]